MINMKNIAFLVIILFFYSLFSNAQQLDKKDSVYLSQLEKEKRSLVKKGLLDSAIKISMNKLEFLEENSSWQQYIDEVVAMGEQYTSMRQGMRTAPLLEAALKKTPPHVDTTAASYRNLLAVTGTIYLRNRALIKAVNVIHKHKKILKNIENPSKEELGRCYQMLTEAYIFMGKPNVYQNLHKTFKIYRDLGDPYALARVQGNLGQVMFLVNPLFGYEILEQAEKNYQKSELTTNKDIAVLNMYMGMSLTNQKKRQEAAKKFNYAYQTFAPKNKDDSTFILALSVNHASNYLDMDSLKRMGKFVSIADNISNQLFAENSYQVSVVDGLKAQWFLEKGQYDSAIYYRSKCIDKQKVLFGEKGHRIGHSYMMISEVYNEQEQYEKALHYAQKALMTDFSQYPNDKEVSFLPKIANNLNATVTIQHLQWKMEILVDLYAQDNNIKWLKLAYKHFLSCDTLMNIQQQSWLDEDMMTHNEVNRSFYNEAVSNSLELYENTGEEKYFNSAYHFASSSKTKLLVYQIKRLANYRSAPSDVSADKQAKEIALSQIEKEYDLVKESNDPVKIDSIEQALFDARLDLMIENERVKDETPQHSSVALSDFRVDIEDITRKLDDNTAIIEYIIGNDELYVFSFTSTSKNVDIVDIDDEFSKNIKRFTRKIKTGSAQLGDELPGYLLEKVYPKIKDKEKLVILPYSRLFNIPFEVLQIPNTNKMLVEDHHISYNYSASLYLRSLDKENQSEEARSIALFAPGFLDNDISEIAENNLYRSASLLEEEGISMEGARSLSALPYSISEVDEISRLFEDKGWKYNIYKGASATENSFRKYAPGKRILHIATHGISDNGNEELSGLFFSQKPTFPSDRANRSDGFLFLKEIYDLGLKNDLVVLSACKSGVGKIYEAEGVFALPRGFIYSGVPNIIVSLWKIHDQKTKELMSAFYRYYLEGNSYSQALQKTKLQMIEKDGLPIDWSGIILIGN